ncbi:MAG: (2Fe-2S)-binding protein [Blastocatellia bacterium]|nr:(2Fe-2S)-binding protein [Blastocatellia bacterium]
MPDTVMLTINGHPVIVPDGSSVATAVAISGAMAFRRSVHGEPRAPLCGMGICFECRVTINGQSHTRSCQIVCQNGMDVQTDE